MATQSDSPDGRTHKDPDRPSPSLVETDSSSKSRLPPGQRTGPSGGDENPEPGAPGAASRTLGRPQDTD